VAVAQILFHLHAIEVSELIQLVLHLFLFVSKVFFLRHAPFLWTYSHACLGGYLSSQIK
jgi:hypothetical protein